MDTVFQDLPGRGSPSGYPGGLAGPFQLEIGTATSQSAGVAATGTQQQTPHQLHPTNSLQAPAPSAPAPGGLTLVLLLAKTERYTR